MRCTGCRRSADSDASRYGKLWCTDCTAAIEFEERLAHQNNMIVADVFVDKAGRLAVVLDGQAGQPSVAEFEHVALTEADVLQELRDAVAAFRRHVIVVGDQLFHAGRQGTAAARRLLDVIGKYRSLLGAQERESAETIEHIARLVTGAVH